jgi:putative aminopeptidase FrvX
VDIIPFLKRLSEASGVSGYEIGVRQVVQAEFQRLADEVRTDALGNVIALKKGHAPEPRSGIMLATHMDEIGLIVVDLEAGYLHFEQVGGYDDRVLLGQEVMVHGRQDLPGIIGARPPHVLPRGHQEQPIPYRELLIDVGRTADELKQLVRVGDLVTMNRQLVELKGGLVAGKAFDNRVSVAAAAVCLEEISRLRHEWDVYVVATVQEEIGYKGAITASYGLAPDIGIAIDVTWAKQPGVADEYTFELGKGPAIAWGPNFHPKLHEALVETARSIELSYQIEAAPRPGGTDAYAIQVAREGIPAAQVSIPERSMHTPVETVSIKDVERTGRLLASFIARLDDGFLATLTWDLGLTEGEEED